MTRARNSIIGEKYVGQIISEEKAVACGWVKSSPLSAFIKTFVICAEHNEKKQNSVDSEACCSLVMISVNASLKIFDISSVAMAVNKEDFTSKMDGL